MEVELKSTQTAVKDFMESFLWKDFQIVLAKWKESLLALYPSAETLLEKGRIDGRLEAIEYLLELPKILILDLQDARVKKLKCENITDESGSSSDLSDLYDSKSDAVW